MSKFYAGIGTHKNTPPYILEIMTHIASHLGTHGWTLRSGAAYECDTAFEFGSDRVNGLKEIYLPWFGYNNSKSPYSPKFYPFSEEEKLFTSRFHPAWSKCSPSARLLHTRNTRILLGSEAIHGDIVQPVKFVVAHTDKGLVQGGTGQGLRIAKALNIPIVNLGEAKSNKELEDLVNQIQKLQEYFDV